MSNQFKQRPVNLNLFTISFPVTAIVSIAHRITGVLIFLYIPFLLCALQMSLASAGDFAGLQAMLAEPLWAIALWVFLVALSLHIFAGLRHLIMDLGFFEELSEARVGAYLVFVLTALFAVGLGIYLW